MPTATHSNAPALLAVLIGACAGAFAQAPGTAQSAPAERNQRQAAWPPADRLEQWNPGVTGGIPNVPVTMDLTGAALAGDGKTDVSAALQRAIDGAKTPGAVLLPPGKFLLSDQVNLRSGVVLRGAGMDRTLLIVRETAKTNWPPEGAIQICGKKGLTHDLITGGATLGSRQLTLGSTMGLEAGELVLVEQEHDPELGGTSEYDRRGQLVRLTKVKGDKATLDTPLRLNYKPQLKPWLEKIAPVSDAGIENLHIRRDNQTGHAIIFFNCAANCWMRDCESELGMTYHVEITCSRRVTVQNCCIYAAHSQAGGGHGYGVEIDGCSSDCLVMNNVFYSLRHAMILQNEANGCVYAYNYSFDAMQNAGTVTNIPTGWGQTCDISLHGGYAYGDLFEGNVVGIASVGDRQPVGPRIVLFRNRLALTQKAHDMAHLAQVSGRQRLGTEISAHQGYGLAIMGNTVMDGGTIDVYPMTGGGVVKLSAWNPCHDLLIAGNLINGRMVWDNIPADYFKAPGLGSWTAGKSPGAAGSPEPLPASLFLKSKPSFWGDKPWPGIGADVDGKAITPLPAEDWYARMQKAGHPVPFDAGR